MTEVIPRAARRAERSCSTERGGEAGGELAPVSVAAVSERKVESAQLRAPEEGPDLATGVGGISIAVGISAVGGIVVAAAPLLRVVTPEAGAVQGGQPAAAALTALLVIAAPLLALVLLRGGRVLGAAGVLSGWATAALAAVVLDLQLFTGPIDANRLELFRPVSAAALHAGAGAVAVLMGHVLMVLAGALALWTMRRSALLDDPDGFDVGLLTRGDAEFRGTSLAARAGGAVSAVASAAAVVVAAALFAPPLSSTDPVVLVAAVVESGRPVLVGTALLAVAVLVVVALALVSTSAPTGAGAVAGVALGALTVCGPRLVAGAFAERIGVGAGSELGTVAAVVLLAGAAALARPGRRGSAVSPAPTELRLPDLVRLHRCTAVLGLLSGVVAVVAALVPVLSIPAGTSQPEVFPARVLLVAGVLLAAVCAVLLTGAFGSTLRPVVAIAWVAPLLGASAVLQAVLVASSVAGVGAGPGAWLTVLAVLLALGCGASAGLAGAVERDEVDTSREVRADPAVLVCAGIAGVAALLGLALPLYAGSDVAAAAIFTTSWGWDSWGLLVVVVAVLAALLVAVRARPARGAALLTGVELVLLVHLLSWPLTSGRLVNSSPGVGVAATMVALVAVPATALLLLRRGAA